MVTEFDRTVIGGGVFGAYASILLAEKGHRVLLIDQERQLLARASMVNQARLHTGLHYPRSYLTAKHALGEYLKFRNFFSEAIRDFDQYYAISAFSSKTTGTEFRRFIQRLGVSVNEIDPETWFNPGTVTDVFQVEEPSFDFQIMRKILEKMLAEHPNIEIRLGERVVSGNASNDEISIALSTNEIVRTDGLVLATYASTNGLRRQMGLNLLGVDHEITEIVIGEVGPKLNQKGFTVMDGPFWSMMPFGLGNQVSLTAVGITPLRRSVGSANFDCQAFESNCNEFALGDCTSCSSRPKSCLSHQKQQMKLYLKHGSEFYEKESLFTVKAILTAASIDDARPTVIHKETDKKIWTILSGKVSSILSLEAGLT